MAQNPEQSAQSAEPATAPAVRPPRRGRPNSSVITSEFEALPPVPGAEPQVLAPRSGPAKPARRPVGPPPSGSRRRRRSRQPRPSFRGPRLADFIGWWRRLRSVVFLVVITVILGMILAAIVAVAIGAIVVSIQHALKSSG